MDIIQEPDQQKEKSNNKLKLRLLKKSQVEKTFMNNFTKTLL